MKIIGLVSSDENRSTYCRSFDPGNFWFAEESKEDERREDVVQEVGTVGAYSKPLYTMEFWHKTFHSGRNLNPDLSLQILSLAFLLLSEDIFLGTLPPLVC